MSIPQTSLKTIIRKRPPKLKVIDCVIILIIYLF